MNECELLRQIYDGKYDYVLNALVKELNEQSILINNQAKIIKDLRNRIIQLEKLNKITHELVVAPALEEVTEERSLNDILEDFANS